MKNCLKKVILLCLLFFPLMSITEGFTAGTLVLTSTGYVPIENVRINDEVICLDACGQLTTRPVVFVAQKEVSTYFRIYCDDTCIQAATNQWFYSVQAQTWKAVSHLQNGELLTCKDKNYCVVHRVERIDEIVTIYLLGVADFHNFCVSPRNIYVHNFIPVIVAGFACAFGLGGIELSTISLGFTIGGAFFGYSLYKKNKQSHGNLNMMVESVSLGGSMFPEEPEDPEEKKRRREESRQKYKPLQNKEARYWAKRFGYKEVKGHPCGNTRGKPVFTDGKKFISPDADGHSGGIWKVFNLRGILEYAMDIALKEICRIY